MINHILFLFIQLSIIILSTMSNSLQPEHSIKILNTENTVLSLGDVDSDDDLEILKSPTNDAQMQKQLNKFHKYVNLIEITERPRKKFYLGSYHLKHHRPLEIYPDMPYTIAGYEKYKMKSERIQKRRKKRKNRKINRRKKTWQTFKLGKKKFKRLPRSLYIDEEAQNSSIEKEYFDYVAQSINNSIAFKYSDEGKPEESIRDVMYKIFDVKTPRNCKNYTGIGIQGVECIVRNFKNGEINEKELIKNISIILLIWFFIYLMIAIPLWCSKGWCCCCCRCAFCFPYKTIADIQNYIEQNPPGICTNSDGVKENHTPTPKETELYDRLRRIIADF